MNIKTINDLEKVIKSKKIFEKYGLGQIGVFGSFARGEDANDIDFYIDSKTYNLKILLELKKELEIITEKEG